jgi:hypothetical protein
VSAQATQTTDDLKQARVRLMMEARDLRDEYQWSEAERQRSVQIDREIDAIDIELKRRGEYL